MNSGGGSRAVLPGGARAASVLLIALPLLGLALAGLLLWVNEREATAVTRERVAAAAKVTAANFRSLYDAAQQRLIRIDQALGPEMNPAGLAASDIGGTGIPVVYDTAGRNIRRLDSPPVGDQEDFKAIAGGQPWRISALIGSALTGRYFVVAKRLERNGRFAGAAAVLVPADLISSAWANVGLGQDSTVGVIRSDGWLVTRFPVPEKTVDLSGLELFTRHLKAAPSGIYLSASSPVDGRSRLVAYTRVDDAGVIATASISTAVISGGFWSRFVSTALLTAPVLVALVLASVWAAVLVLRQERSRRELETALAQNRMLFREIHHRVKNNLQAVSAMVALQDAPRAMKDDLNRRIAAMTAVHEHMYESDQFDAFDAADYLGKLLAELRASAPPGVAIEWRLDSMRLSPDRALPLGLIVNEAVTNAFKHAFPDGRPGKVEVDLALAGGEAALTVRDNGAGPAQAASSGMGSRLIDGLVRQLDGASTATSDGGYRLEVRFPA